MWARVVEFMLACWLAISPFVFQHSDQTVLWAVDFTAAALVIVLALLSYWPPTRYSHLGILVVAAAMIAFGRHAGGLEPAAGFQNHLVVGLLLLMFALVPSRASQPPQGWYPQYRESAPRL